MKLSNDDDTEAVMPQNKDTGKGLSEQQLDDLDVNRQRERLERSRQEEGNRQAGEGQGNRQSGKTEQPDKP